MTHHSQPSGVWMSLTVLLFECFQEREPGNSCMFKPASQTSAVRILCRSHATLDSAAQLAGVGDAPSYIACCQQMSLSGRSDDEVWSTLEGQILLVLAYHSPTLVRNALTLSSSLVFFFGCNHLREDQGTGVTNDARLTCR